MNTPNWDNPLAAAIPAKESIIFEGKHKKIIDNISELSEKLPPVNPDDKRVVNGMTDVNQLAPFKYSWAWEFFLNANKNHWTPLDIYMS